MNKKAHILVGISGSGKSTRAAEIIKADFQMDSIYSWIELNLDDIRAQMLYDKKRWTNKTNMWNEWNWKWEKEVKTKYDELYNLAVTGNHNLIFSNTNLSKEKVYALRDDLLNKGYEVIIEVLQIDWREAIKRDQNRRNVVGAQVIYEQYLRLCSNWDVRPLYTPDETKFKAVIFDIDGTLTLGMNDRSAYDWEKVHQDLPNPIVVMLAQALKAQGYKIIVMSGRDSVCRGLTAGWLMANLGVNGYDELWMRRENDQRRDSIIKEELFWNHIAPRYNVVTVVDDRPQVLKELWLPIGMKTICIGNPYVDF